MTFRTRLVAAAAVAVVIAVLAAAIASYFAARNSLLGSVDVNLASTATNALTPGNQLELGQSSGLAVQIVVPSGAVVFRTVYHRLPVDDDVRAVASGKAPAYYASVTVDHVDYREYVVHLPAGTRISGSFLAPAEVLTSGGALQLATPLTGVDTQLGDLGLVLALVAAAGVALALLLGWLVGRTALVPLNDLTWSVEEVAETTDVSKRLDPGGPDELGRLRRAVNHLLAALERSREAQRQLVLDAGHELRTPLTSLRTNLEVVRRLEELPPHERDVLVDDLLTQMQELTNLVSDLSELARGEQRLTPPAPIRLDQLVEDAVAVATTHGRSRDVRFQLHGEPTWVQGQRERIARAVGNLLDNALKWSPEGGTVEVWCGGGVLAVRDHGPGIAPEDLPHVFDRFYRAPSARALPGSGLGLAIVAQVAEAEGGSATAANAEGGGAAFRLQLPVVPPSLHAETGDD
ncbi:MAG: HAMP domain-containing sensor histidine kinase [Acidimicrobiales bacterium]